MSARAFDKKVSVMETSKYSIWRMIDSGYGAGSVIVKESRSSQPSRREIAQLKHEYDLLTALSGIEGVPRALGLEIESHRAAMILEDFGGISLAQFVQNGRLTLEQFFFIAPQIVRIVGEMHLKDVAHCDLKPHNILINPESMKIQIIDFGCSQKLIGRGQFQSENQGMTLAYIAPEQTGRMNRRIDHRTDIYSLGVAFYELLSGQLPFKGADALEWVHAHIAKHAKPLSDVDNRIPPIVSQIVAKMMSKAQEDRYQVAEGLMHDLIRAAGLYSMNRPWDVFPLGERDRSRHFALSQKVVGRDDELRKLGEAWESARQVQSLVLISGAAGSGKSTLMREFRKTLADRDGLFAFARFDVRQIEFPFGGLTSATDDLIHQLTNVPNDARAKLVKRIREKLGDQVAALVPVVPKLGELLGEMPKISGTADNEGRLHLLFAEFLSVVIEERGPVTLFADDCQYVDEASAKTFSFLASRFKVPGLSLISSYRTKEPKASRHLSTFLSAFEETGRSLHLELGSLSTEHLCEYVLDTLKIERPRAVELADLLYKKSGGNPDFVVKTFSAWHQDGLLRSDEKKLWVWDPKAIEATDIDTNVLDLLGTKLKSMPRTAQDVMTAASVFMSGFTASELSDLTGFKLDDVEGALQSALELRLLTVDVEGAHQFIHEQVRESAHKLLKPETRQKLHAELGLRALKNLDAQTSHDVLYATAEHLNEGLSKIKDPVLRFEVARLDLRVGQMARDAAAFPLALKYASAGIRAADGSAWDARDAVLVSLFILKGECEFLTGQQEIAEKTFAYVRKQSIARVQYLKASVLYTSLLSYSNRLSEATDEALRSLEWAGIKLPRNPSKLYLLKSLLVAFNLIRGNRPSQMQLLDMKAEGSEFIALRHALIIEAGRAAYFSDKKTWLMVCLATIPIVSREGLSPDYAPGIMSTALIFAKRFGRYREAEKICEQTIDRLERGGVRHGLQLLFRNGLLRPWIRSWEHVCLPGIYSGFETSRNEGDPVSASSSALYYIYYHFYLGKDLDVSDRLNELAKYIVREDRTMRNSAMAGIQTLQLLKGATKSTLTLTSDSFDEAEYLEEIKTGALNPTAWHAIHKMFGLVLFGHYQEAEAWIEKARTGHENIPFSLAILFECVFSSITLIEKGRREGRLGARDKKAIEASLRLVSRWSEANPRDFAPYHALLSAEWQAWKGHDLEAMASYEAGVKSALVVGSWMMSGIINERSARFHKLCGRDRLAIASAEEAAYSYERWGSPFKASHVRKSFELTKRRESSADPTGSSTTDGRQLGSKLDLDAIIKSTHAISSELELESLANRLTSVIMECAGGGRALLLMVVDVDNVFRSVAGSESTEYSAKIVERVTKRREAMVITDSSKDEDVTGDPYFTDKKAMSVLCLPIVHKGDFHGIVYIENDSATDVFTSERLEILNILVNQAAISIENAKLYSDVAEKARMTGELKTAQAVQKTLFPEPVVEFPGLEIAGHYTPATECGGDWWFYHPHGDKVFIYIGDATGHGVSAALLTSAARSAVSLLSQAPILTPKIAMEKLNRAIYETSKGSMNMTFFIGCYDPKTGDFDYCNASHESPFWVKAEFAKKLHSSGDEAAAKFKAFRDGLGSIFDVHGPRLGEEREAVFRESRVTMSSGDLLLLYTDGVRDAVGPNKQQWGARRLVRALFDASRGSMQAEEAVRSVVSENERFRGETPLDDDVMVIACSFKRP